MRATIKLDLAVGRMRLKPSEALHSNRAAIRRVVESHRARNARIFGSVLRGRAFGLLSMPGVGSSRKGLLGDGSRSQAARAMSGTGDQDSWLYSGLKQGMGGASCGRCVLWQNPH